MCQHQNSARILIAAVTVCCMCLPTALAAKPDKPGSGGGGGGNNGVTYEVGQLDTHEGSADDINEYGEVVGSCDSNLVVGDDAFPQGRAVAWLLDWDGSSLNVVTQGPVIDPTGINYSVATSVNEAGDIVGEFQVPGEWSEAFHVNAELDQVARVVGRAGSAGGRRAVVHDGVAPGSPVGTSAPEETAIAWAWAWRSAIIVPRTR